MPRHQPPVVLIFAASDPTSGAGLQADLLTVSSMGCHGVTVVTGLTVQDTIGVEAFVPIDAALVARQAQCLLEDMPVAAIKIGVLGSVATVATVASIAARHPAIPVVLDPVLASGRGDPLSVEDIGGALLEVLLPRVTVLTPNCVEARYLASWGGDGARQVHELDACAARLVAAGCKFVLVTGTHEETPEVCNSLYDAAGLVRRESWPRLDGTFHGSGCTLASALAALLAKGLSVPEAAHDAQEYTWQALAAGITPGAGQGIPDRFFWARGSSANDA